MAGSANCVSNWRSQASGLRPQKDGTGIVTAAIYVRSPPRKFTKPSEEPSEPYNERIEKSNNITTEAKLTPEAEPFELQSQHREKL